MVRKPGPRKPGGPKKVRATIDVNKKAHHFIKLVVKSLKKARDFEVRKLLRRVKQLESSAGDTATTEKVLAQLSVAKAVDLDHLSLVVAPFLQPAAGDAVGLQQAETDIAQALQPVEKRICGAKCVTSQVAIAQAGLQALQQRAAQAADKQVVTAQQEPAQTNEGLGDEVDTPLSSSEEVGEGSRPKDVDATASSALEKLLAARHRAPVQAAAEASSTGTDEDDSGLFVSDDDISSLAGSDVAVIDGEVPRGQQQAEQIQMHEQQQQAGQQRTRQSASGQQAHVQRQPLGSNAADRQTKAVQQNAKTKAQPKKSKNRLGQRARRRLAGQQHEVSRPQQQYRDRQARGQSRQVQVPGKVQGSKNQHLQQQQQPQTDKPERMQKKNATEHDNSGLHPSWAAKKKQKLQMATAAPAAVKITFDDAGRPAGYMHAVPQPSVAASDLHPSWAAAKLHRAALLQQAGKQQAKKVVFNDSD